MMINICIYVYIYILFRYNLCKKKYYFSTSLFGGKCRDIDRYVLGPQNEAQKNKEYFLLVI